MIRKIATKDYLLMSHNDLAWNYRQFVGHHHYGVNPNQTPYFVLEKDINDAIASVLPHKDNVIEGKDKVYFTKTSTIPRYKLKEYLDNNNIALDRTNRKEKATTFIVNFNTIKYLKKEIQYNPEDGYIKVPIDEYKRVVGSLSKDAQKYMTQYNPSFILSGNKDLLNTCPNAELTDFHFVHSGWGYDKINNIIDSINYVLEKKDDIKIVFDETLLEQCTKEITIDSEIYESIRSMLGSKDEGNRSLAIEMISNCNYVDSKYYILFLLNEFWNSSVKQTTKTTNFINCLKYFQSYKNTMANHWQLLVDTLLKEKPADEHKELIKKYIINRINATTLYRGASFKIEEVKLS